MTYPKRGDMSADGKYFTHTDGSVHERIDTELRGWLMCSVCSLKKAHDECDVSGSYPCSDVQVFKRIEGAYVPSAYEQEACDMARAMIKACNKHFSCARCIGVPNKTCLDCAMLDQKSCPARAYLAAHGATDAWEVTP